MSPNTFDSMECPNCGGSYFEDLAKNQHRCVYCGTVLTLREPEPGPPPDQVRCPRCGMQNERGARYCNHCGRPFPIWGNFFKRADPATISMIVTAVGMFVIPIPLVSPIAGLVLGYRALKSARAGGNNSEKLAKIAVIFGWVGAAYTALPLCLFVGSAGYQIMYTVCGGLWDELVDLVGRIGR
jgi:hypothetical protein